MTVRKKHKATINGVEYSLTRESWARMLEITEGALGNGLHRYNTMQAYIDAEFKGRLKFRSIRDKFLFGGSNSGSASLAKDHRPLREQRHTCKRVFN